MRYWGEDWAATQHRTGRAAAGECAGTGEPQALLCHTGEPCYKTSTWLWERDTAPGERQWSPKTPARAETAAPTLLNTASTVVQRKERAAPHRWSKLWGVWFLSQFLIVLGMFFLYSVGWEQDLVMSSLLWVKHPLSFVHLSLFFCSNTAVGIVIYSTSLFQLIIFLSVPPLSNGWEKRSLGRV